MNTTKQITTIQLSDMSYVSGLQQTNHDPFSSDVSGLYSNNNQITSHSALRNSTKRNDIVLDPFCGSGSTLIAAALEGRNSIGIDADKHACDITVARCRERNIEYNFVEDSL